jgi:ABC-2 type transport system ATP-binding protein
VHDPDVLLLDEPASGLDPRARVEMREILKEISRMKKTVLVSSHILPELADLSTEVGIIHHGRMVASGSVESIISRLGASRVLEVRVLDKAVTAAKVLKDQPGIKDVEIPGEEGLIRAAFSGDASGQVAILNALHEADIPVMSFNTVGGLEELFMTLTEEESKT